MVFTRNLPAPVTSFVGRRHDIAEVRRHLSAARLVTLVGVGGVGKTRLALEAVAQLRSAFGRAHLVDLSPVRDAALVARTMVTALDLPDQPGKPAEQLLVEYLADKPLLIVMDNCEHVADASAMLADRLLRDCPRLRILATSRQTLAIRGERVYTVSPLSAPDPDFPPSLPAMAQWEAVHLLVDAADRARAHTMPQADQLTLDAPMAPLGVFPSQPEDQVTDFGGDRWAT
jgi:predicted ATPase